MEREGVEDTARVLRAIRSLVYNRRILPIIERRIFQAETTIRAHLLVRDSTDSQVGPYEVEVDEENIIWVTHTACDEWRQLHLPDVDTFIHDPLELRIVEQP